MFCSGGGGMRAMELYRGLGHQAELEGNEKRLQQLQLSLVLFEADSYITCRSHAAPMPFPCHAVR